MSKALEWLRSNKWCLILQLWASGVLIGSAQLVYTRAVPFQYGHQIMYDCREEWSDDTFGQLYTLVVFVFTFALPVSILLFVYSIIAFHIRRHVTPGNPDQLRDQKSGNRKHKVIKILAMIVILFAVCWLPIHVFSLLVWFYPEILSVQTKFGYRTFIWSYIACHFLSMAHSFINPIVYCFMSQNFRENLGIIFNGFLEYPKCRQNDETMDESEITCRSQVLTLHSAKLKREQKISVCFDVEV